MTLIGDTVIARESFICPEFSPDEDSARSLRVWGDGVGRCVHASSALRFMVIADAAPGKDTFNS
jgi:hypothetical protein